MHRPKARAQPEGFQHCRAVWQHGATPSGVRPPSAPASSLAPNLVQGCRHVTGTRSHGTPHFYGISGAPSTSQYPDSQPCWTSADRLSSLGQRVAFGDRLRDKTNLGLEGLRGGHCLAIQLPFMSSSVAVGAGSAPPALPAAGQGTAAAWVRSPPAAPAKLGGSLPRRRGAG